MPLHLQYYEVIQAIADPRNPERPAYRPFGSYATLPEAREALRFLPAGSTIVQCRVVEVKPERAVLLGKQPVVARTGGRS